MLVEEYTFFVLCFFLGSTAGVAAGPVVIVRARLALRHRRGPFSRQQRIFTSTAQALSLEGRSHILGCLRDGSM